MTEQKKTGRAKSASSAISPDERERMIAEAAYFRAQQRGFAGGDPLEDWLSAEAEVDRLLRKGAPARQPGRAPGMPTER